MARKELIVALDFASREQALAMATTLSGRVRWLKVGLELFCRTGPEIVATLKKLGFKVFLDLKFMDIPNTVRGAVASACRSGADMLTIHLMGGEAMATAALDGTRAAENHSPLLIGVSVLTSMTKEDLCFAPAMHGDLEEAVLTLSDHARKWGLDGIVCSGQEVQRVREQSPHPFAIVTPGIRMGNQNTADDQQRVSTPEAAVAAGSDYLVVGRPITRAGDPVHAAQCYLDAIEEYA
jgi:orotidine-5'-phosphate decarboxylase